MLAWTDPETPLDRWRLSDFSPEPEKSHGARTAHRTPPHRRSSRNDGLSRANVIRLSSIKARFRRDLSARMRRASDRRADRAAVR
jgi:hypothetical protein